MFKISATSEYALLLVVFLKKNAGVSFTLEDLAGKISVPENCLRKITGKLERAGIIESKKGRGGGIMLAKETLSVADVLTAVGENSKIAHCAWGCGKNSSCDLSVVFANLERGFHSILSLTKL